MEGIGRGVDIRLVLLLDFAFSSLLRCFWFNGLGGDRSLFYGAYRWTWIWG